MDVIKKLRVEIILVVMGVQTILLAGIFIFLVHMVSNTEISKAHAFLENVVMNDGRLPRNKPPHKLMTERESSFFPIELKGTDDFRRCFSVKMTTEGEIIEILSDFPLNFTKEELFEFITRVVQKSANDKKIINGESDGILYCAKLLDDGNAIMSFVDMRGEITTIHHLSRFVFYIFLISLIFSFVLTFFLSSSIVYPVKSAFLKQKQFVADAGHELKTPIAVIGANLDVLMPDMPDNRWLNYIKTENERMGHLVKNLLYIAKSDADRLDYNYLVFDFSSAIKNAVLPFESVAFEEMKHLELDIDDDIFFTGDEQKIKQIAVILVDNAIKNSDKDALIRVSAVCEKDKIIFKVFNTGSGIKKEDLEKIFLRFYRSDSSRARKTGGYGLGLAIARLIADHHGGTLVADSDFGNWAEFTLTLPLRVSKRKTFLRFFENFGNSK